jgi:hypothetical protein
MDSSQKRQQVFLFYFQLVTHPNVPVVHVHIENHNPERRYRPAGGPVMGCLLSQAYKQENYCPVLSRLLVHRYLKIENEI